MLERTLVFVDTSYLLASFYNSWETGARAQLEIDLPEVVSTMGGMIEEQLGNPIQRQYWYDGIPDTGPHRYQRALRTCEGVQLRTGQLIEWGERRTQKGVDTRLVADMVMAAVKNQFTDFVLVSGDADMIPGAQTAVDNGIRVHLYGFGWDSMSAALRHTCDSTTILDPREDFADSMELQVLEGPLPPVVRDAAQKAEGAEEELPGTEHCDEREEPSEVETAFGTPEKPTPAPTPKPAPPQSAQQAATPAQQEQEKPAAEEAEATDQAAPKPAPKPSMMAPRRKLRSKYVPLPEEVWSSAGFQSPFDVGQQYASWWFDNAANSEQRDQAHLLSGGGLPPEIDRPLLQFACETLHEYTLTETQRVNLRDGFHSGIRGVLINIRREN